MTFCGLIRLKSHNFDCFSTHPHTHEDTQTTKPTVNKGCQQTPWKVFCSTALHLNTRRHCLQSDYNQTCSNKSKTASHKQVCQIWQIKMLHDTVHLPWHYFLINNILPSVLPYYHSTVNFFRITLPGPVF